MQDQTDPEAPCTEGHADRLKAFVRQRLTGDAMRQDWRRIIEAAWLGLMDTPVQQVVPQDAILSLVESYLQPERIADLVRPGIRAVLPAIVAQMRLDNKPLGRWVPDDAKAAMRALASERGLVHEDWVRALFR